MYHTSVPLHFQWPYSIPTTNVHGAIARSNSPVFITGCNDLVSVLPMERFATPTLCAIPTNRIITTMDISNLRFPDPRKNYREPVNKLCFPNPHLPKNPDGMNQRHNGVNRNLTIPEHVGASKDEREFSSNCAKGQKRHHEGNKTSPRCSSSDALSKKLKSESSLETVVEPNKIDSADVTAENEDSDSEKIEMLSQTIWNFYKRHRQTEEMFERKMRLRDALFSILREIYPCCGLYIVGSSLTQLGLKQSDLDLCLMLTHKEINQETEATTILNLIFDKIVKLNFITHPQVIQAKVPILKFIDRVSGVEVDLNINNSVGIRNTQLIHCYSRLDWRFAPLSVVIKVWARQHNINDARNMTLSSYSLILMLTHFLQCCCDPPVLPCLQKLLSDKFNPFADVRKLTLREDLPAFKSDNQKNLGTLLLDFFHYFGHEFDFSKDVMSVRTGGKLPKHIAINCKSPKNKRGQWRFICIEEPMDRTNTARSVFDETAFSRIVETFRMSYQQLQKSKIIDSVIDMNAQIS